MPPPEPAPTLTVPMVLAEVGPQLSGAADSIAIEEAYTSLDFVRRGSFVGDTHALSVSTVLMGDSLERATFSVHEHPDPTEQFRAGAVNLSAAFRELQVLGGCMMKTKWCAFPVVLLYSDVDRVLMTYAPGVSLAALEKELYDTAWEEPGWEKTVLGKETAKEIMKSRREGAIASSKVGYDKLPAGAIQDKAMHVCRHGVLPFLLLRVAENSAEHGRVASAVEKALHVLPKCECDSLIDVACSDGLPITLVTVLEREPRNLDARPPSCKTAREPQSWKAVLDRPILTSVASVVLKKSADTANDVYGEPISEGATNISHDDSHRGVLAAMGVKEQRLLGGGILNVCTMLKAANEAVVSYSLPSCMEEMNVEYTTRLLADASKEPEQEAACSVAKLVAAATFKEGHAEKALEACDWKCAIVPGGDDQPSMLLEGNNKTCLTIGTAVCTLAACLPEHQAIVVAWREPDGRFGEVRMFRSKGEGVLVGRDAFARLACLCPWATVLIVSGLRVYELVVRSAARRCGTSADAIADVNALELARAATIWKEKLVVRDPERGTSNPQQELLAANADAVSVLGQLASKLQEELRGVVKSVSEGAMKSTDNLVKMERLLDRSLSVDVPPAPPAPSASDATALSLKRTFVAVQALHKRMRQAP